MQAVGQTEKHQLLSQCHHIADCLALLSPHDGDCSNTRAVIATKHRSKIKCSDQTHTGTETCRMQNHSGWHELCVCSACSLSAVRPQLTAGYNSVIHVKPLPLHHTLLYTLSHGLYTLSHALQCQQQQLDPITCLVQLLN